MTPLQIAQHRDVYERLRALGTPPGYSVYVGGRLIRQSYVDKSNWTWEDAMAAPETEFERAWQRVHGRAALATVGMAA